MEWVFKAAAPGPDDMTLINAMAMRELGADEVYTFALRLCDNEIDRDFERFDDQALDELAGLFLGAPGIFDHCWSARGQTARLYHTEVVTEQGQLTSDGRPYRWLKGWAYMMRTEDNADLIAEIDGGIKREVSVGCAVERVTCSICGQDLHDCFHEKGEMYNGQICHGVLCGAKDAYEWSFVAVPAQRQAGVVKNKRYGGPDPHEPGEEPPPSDDGKALQRAKALLELEKIRYGGNQNGTNQ